MLAILADRSYRHLFLAQVVALLGTGLATVALGLLAYDLAGERAGLVLGMVFTIKMVAYVGVAPIAGAFADRVPRRALLVTLDLLRAGAALALPFVTEVWQVYVLIFALQSASAAFTPLFQATIPDVLPEEDRYTRALSLSRLAYDLESLVSPLLAGLLLAVMSYNALFLGTVAGFVASAALVISVLLPRPNPAAPRERRAITPSVMSRAATSGAQPPPQIPSRPRQQRARSTSADRTVGELPVQPPPPTDSGGKLPSWLVKMLIGAVLFDVVVVYIMLVR